MATDFQQTDTAAFCLYATSCYGGTIGETRPSLKAIEGGTPGTDTQIAEPGIPNGSTEWATIFFEIIPGADFTQWAAGTYTVPLNVTRGNANISWEHTYICRLDLNCANLGLIGSLSDQEISLATEEVFDMDVSGALVASPASTDRIYIILVLKNVAEDAQEIEFTSDQIIATPLSEGGGGGSNHAAIRRRRVA